MNKLFTQIIYFATLGLMLWFAFTWNSSLELISILLLFSAVTSMFKISREGQFFAIFLLIIFDLGNFSQVGLSLLVFGVITLAASFFPRLSRLLLLTALVIAQILIYQITLNLSEVVVMLIVGLTINIILLSLENFIKRKHEEIGLH